MDLKSAFGRLLLSTVRHSSSSMAETGCADNLFAGQPEDKCRDSISELNSASRRVNNVMSSDSRSSRRFSTGFSALQQPRFGASLPVAAGSKQSRASLSFVSGGLNAFLQSNFGTSSGTTKQAATSVNALLNASDKGTVLKPTQFMYSIEGGIDEYERGDLSYGKAMLAGASAGVMEHVAMYPVDTAKTRMQVSPAIRTEHGANVVTAMVNIAKSEGVSRLYRGVGAVALGAVPSHAVYFAAIEYCKELFGGNQPGHQVFANAAAASAATCAHDAVVTPLDVVKQRLQVYKSPYGGIMHCIRETLKQEGFRAFYASYPLTVVMNIPFAAVNYATFESVKLLLSGDSGDHGPLQEIIAGGCGGALGGLVSTPLDVIKTRIQTDNFESAAKRPSVGQVVRDIMKEEGARGFTRGTTARVLFFMPSAAICWTTYETMKRVLGWNR